MDKEIKRIHKEGGGKKEEEEESKGGGGNDDAGEGEDREGATSLEVSSEDNKIYGVIASGKGTITNAKYDAKGNGDK